MASLPTKPMQQILGVEVFFIVSIQDSKRDAVGGADTDGVGNLPGIHMQKHAEAWRNGDAAPDVKGEAFRSIPENTAYGIGKAAAEFVGENHGCKKIFTACMVRVLQPRGWPASCRSCVLRLRPGHCSPAHVPERCWPGQHCQRKFSCRFQEW